MKILAIKKTKIILLLKEKICTILRKNILRSMLDASDFYVIDLGIDVSVKNIIELEKTEYPKHRFVSIA